MIDFDTRPGRFFVDGAPVRYVYRNGVRLWLSLGRLMRNGDAATGTNANFAQWVYSADAPPGAAGSFSATLPGYAAKISDDWMEVDQMRDYRLRMYAKCSNASATHYLGIMYGDASKNIISPVDYEILGGSTLTTLAAPLTPGQTTVQLTSAAGWHNGTIPSYRNIRFGRYVDAFGTQFGDYGFSKWGGSGTGAHSPSGVWAAGGIAGNVITLAAPYGGQAFPSGHPVCNGIYGNSYHYFTSNQPVPTSWTLYDLPLPDTSIWPGTRYARLVILLNYNGLASTFSIGNVRFDAQTVVDAE